MKLMCDVGWQVIQNLDNKNDTEMDPPNLIYKYWDHGTIFSLLSGNDKQATTDT
ncbi:UNVERIFIED_CONTAM: hypothetical protein FKN15_061630 [Acipenser sinensis]